MLVACFMPIAAVHCDALRRQYSYNNFGRLRNGSTDDVSTNGRSQPYWLVATTDFKTSISRNFLRRPATTGDRPDGALQASSRHAMPPSEVFCTSLHMIAVAEIPFHCTCARACRIRRLVLSHFSSGTASQNGDGRPSLLGLPPLPV